MASKSDSGRRLAITLSALATLAFPPTLQGQTQTDLSAAVASLEWREIGPTIMSGRISDLAVVESNPAMYFVGTATGGLWKTVNGGISFEMVFAPEETSSIGDVTVAPSNPNVVWVGTGEPQNRQSSPWGNGVYLSRDGGNSWEHRGLAETHHISRIQVHPTDPDVAYVAAVGHLWGSNPERGVYRTTDGGESWEKVLFIDDHTGAIDLVMDPNDPRTLFAAMYQRQRKSWGFNGGGPGSGIYRTVDGGDHWEELTEGLPDGDKGRIGLDIYRRDGNLVYAIVEADARDPESGFQSPRRNGVYRSTDRGDTWELMSNTNNRPMYYSQIRIDPNDPERLYAGGANLYRTSDGGRTFTPDAAAGVHLDHHALWINPENSNHLLLGSDGGVSVSWDRSDSWYQFRNLPVSQFYEIGIDMREPYHVCGGLQDNGSWCAPSDTWSNQGIRTRDWYNVGSGDGFFTVFHPDGRLMFAESQGGNIIRVDLDTNERSRLRPVARPSADGEEPDLRWNWNSPIVLSTHDENTVYHGGNYLFRSRDLGQSWEAISPDLTYAVDREELEIMGVLGSEPQMSLNDGQSSYGNLTAVAESPLSADVLYTGSDDGRVMGTRDGGATWTDLTPNFPGLPEHTYVTRLVASHAAAGTVYAALDGHRNDDFRPYVYRSDDFGASWMSIVEGLPMTSVNALAQHHETPDLWFLGNELGVYFSVDGGQAWNRLANNLPTVPVDDIEIHPRDNDLIIGTHGRGIWIMDDISPLQQLGAPVIASALHAFPVGDAIAYTMYRPQGWTPGIWVADNPAPGAAIQYWVGESATRPIVDGAENGDGGAAQEPSDSVEITIVDGSGSPVRSLTGSSQWGVQAVQWDLRIDPPYAAEGGNQGGFGGPPSGPVVLPGSYTARVAINGHTSETAIEVRLDPRVEIAQSDLMTRQEHLMEAYHLAKPLYEAGQAVSRVRGQLQEAKGLLADQDDAPSALGEEVDALLAELEEVNEELGEVRGDMRGASSAQGVYGAPTADQIWQLDQAWEAAPGIIQRINAIVSDRMPALNRQLDEANVRPDPGSAIPVPRRPGE